MAVCADCIWLPIGIVAVIALAPAGCTFSQFEASPKKLTCASGVGYGGQFTYSVAVCVVNYIIIFVIYTHTATISPAPKDLFVRSTFFVPSSCSNNMYFLFICAFTTVMVTTTSTGPTLVLVAILYRLLLVFEGF